MYLFLCLSRVCSENSLPLYFKIFDTDIHSYNIMNIFKVSFISNFNKINHTYKLYYIK